MKNVEVYLEKILLLEKTVGSKINYCMLESFCVEKKDIVSIQKVAKQIANFVGLNDYMFIIAITTQKKNVGGHIELQNGPNEVFIEISEELLKFDDAILATLAHEITHKYLHINNISLADEYDNEILTDIATVFLGLGKLMLNGCQCENIKEDYIPEGTKTTTESIRTGYLQLDEFIFVYHLVCAMRKIPFQNYNKGLSRDLLPAMQQCNQKYGWLFSKSFHNKNFISKKASEFYSVVRILQKSLASLDKNLICIKRSCVDFTDSYLENTHKRIYFMLNDIQNNLDSVEYNPCLKFLKGIKFENEIKHLIVELQQVLNETKVCNKNVKKIIKKLRKPFLKPHSKMFNVVTCHNDGVKLKLPENQIDLVGNCPKCGYKFFADTSIPGKEKILVLKKIFKSVFRLNK